MRFEKIRDGVIKILTESPLRLGGDRNQYEVIDFQRSSQNADQSENFDRTVQVFYSNGSFPKSGGSLYRESKHEINISIQMTVAATSKTDLRTLNNENSTVDQLKAALAATASAASEADRLMDDLYSRVYNTIMAAENKDLGVDDGCKVGDRWLDNFSKDDPLERGSMLVLTAKASLTCSTFEEIVFGPTPKTLENNNITLQNKEDNANSGVIK